MYLAENESLLLMSNWNISNAREVIKNGLEQEIIHYKYVEINIC